MVDEEIIEYLIKFVVNDSRAEKYICYGEPLESDKLIIIAKSTFFNDSQSDEYVLEPALPLNNIEGKIPFLFGEDRIDRQQGRTVIYADLIASSYFLLTRYDEAFFEITRDKHNRPVGKDSFRARAGILNRPLVDEYGEFIREELKRFGIKFENRKIFNHIYLTHDVDCPWREYSLVNGLKQSIKNIASYKLFDISPIFNAMGWYRRNSCDTFEWLHLIDAKAKTKFGDKAEDIYFLIGADESSPNTPKYWNDPKATSLIDYLKENASVLGLHASYESAYNEDLVSREIENLEKTFSLSINSNRNHYLMSNDIGWLSVLEKNGISDDYTIGYADAIGYRLSTTRAVRWIDPRTEELHDLMLHPLHVMDTTIVAPQYMGLDKESAMSALRQIVDDCVRFNGDFTILFHNDMLSDGRYRWVKELYSEVVDYICSSCERQHFMDRFDNSIEFALSTVIHNDRLKTYRKYIKHALSNGYNVVSMIDFYNDMKSDKKHFVLRHDVDYSTPATRKMFEVEKELGVKSTYYFRKSTIDRNLIHEMENEGFEVGFHFETLSDYAIQHNLDVLDESDLNACRKILKMDIEDQKQIYNLQSICSHGAPMNGVLGMSNNVLTEDRADGEFGILFEAYDKEIYDHVSEHIMDCNIRYGCGFSYKSNPIDAINEGKQNIIFLAHPNHWFETFGDKIHNIAAFAFGRYQKEPVSEFTRIMGCK